jgi:hypothetical protein
VLEPDEEKPSSPVLKGLGASNGARLLEQGDSRGFSYVWLLSGLVPQVIAAFSHS